ncbi:copper chaperone PCu(A)C [Rhodanobacter sp. AS-Z3]|uniref:copper chaperone PCu(A)C n=1 Tax=Rhodanobacter sp. AS-Z3 TaxID=3031330 RepID=UPI00247963CC|nr:copper chaperone PCu(A)C [Rhodanobacter sp. AS-Z3]WEN14430.1 copper chaperone PCu(A)C [Rhodanobacter sp. AS-Z3]
MKMPKLPMLTAGLLLACGVHATDAEHIRASHAWIRVLPSALPAGGYVTLENDSDQPIALQSASSTNYADVMLHQSSTAGGVSRMSMVDAMSVPAHGKAQLAPAGYHLMLMQPKQPIKPGDTVVLTLKFSDGSTLAIDFIARPANALDAGDEHAMPGMDHDGIQHAH